MSQREQHLLFEQFDKAQDLMDAGRTREGLRELMQLVDENFAPAYFELAAHHFYNADRQDVRPWLDKLEAAAAAGDADASLRCFHAYRAGWAQGGFERDGPIGSAYLLRAAELGHGLAQWLLADEHRSGANGQVKDEQFYLYWVEKAIASGNEDAIYFHAKWLAGKGRAVPESLLKALEDVAQDFPKAARLLERLRRRNKP